jgi:hypothetical protein
MLERCGKLIELITNPDYPQSYAYAKSTGTCIGCGSVANAFKDASARLEYSISGLCQACQDEYFNRIEVNRDGPDAS